MATHLANYRTLLRSFPAIADYFRHARWVRRGDVLAYPPKVRTPHFSIDALGFRHTHFEGSDLGLENSGPMERFGLLLGSSHSFGFGLAANADTLASRLSEASGICYLNICYPEADTRTLFASLVRTLRAANGRVSHVILISGGDFTRWCFHVRADALFGSPMLPMPGDVPPPGALKTEFRHLLHFNFFWTRLCKEAATAAGAKFLLADDVTFFEKSAPDAIERAAALGEIAGEGQQIRFSSHRQLALTFQAERRRFAASEGIAMGPFPHADELLYIDEYHYRAESQADIARTLLGAWD